MKVITAILILVSTYLAQGHADQSAIDEVETIEYFCSIDSSYQKALYYLPDIDGPTPLLVALHPWTSDYTNPNYVHYADYCMANGWAFIHPDFRGKNNNPDATGSEKAIQDIVDAVRFAESNSLIDTNRIFLAGASGGGHAALLTAGKFPTIWAGVSAWVPITDLVKWYEETKARDLKYWQDIYNSCGGDPTSDTTAYNEAWDRSPINFLHNAKDVAIDISAGINDGHGNYSVPISHSLYAFNKLADESDTLTKTEIDFFVLNAAVPENLTNEMEEDPLFGDRSILFRRKSGNVRVTIFDGGHEIIYHAACEWLSGQTKNNPNGIDNQINNTKFTTYSLSQNYPNPFNPSTVIEYSIPALSELAYSEAVNSRQYSVGSRKNSASNIRNQVSSIQNQELVSVQMKVYNVLGRQVAILVNEQKPPGNYKVQFNGSDLTSGVYFYILTAGNYSENKKMLLLR